MKKTAVLSDTSPVAPPTDKAKGYWELKIPRVNLQESGTNGYLVFALVIFSFFLGMLTNKVMYLEQQVKNPQANTAVAAGNDTPTVEAPPPVVDVAVGKLPLKGDANAPVTIVEFSDFQCPFCKSFYDDKLFATQDTWSPQEEADAITSFVTYAGELGLDTTKFQSCLANDTYKKAVEDDMAAASQVQVDGTPAFFVNGYRMVGAQPFSEFERIIEEELKK